MNERSPTYHVHAEGHILIKNESKIPHSFTGDLGSAI